MTLRTAVVSAAVAFACSADATAGVSAAGDTYALLVGIDVYDENYIAPVRWLDQCGVDLDAAHDTLVDACAWPGDQVTTLRDAEATRTSILERLAQLADRTKPGDRVLFYQSSHGMRNPWGESYLCAYDADLTSEDLAAAFAHFPTGVKLLAVVDACYSGGLFAVSTVDAAYAADDFAADVTTHLAWLNRSPVGWITSSAEDELSYELEEGPGAVFSRAWTRAIATGAADSADVGGDGDGTLTAYESFIHAAGCMGGYPETPQCPYPDVCRDFVLRHVKGVSLFEAFGIEGEGRSGGWFASETDVEGVIAQSGAILDAQTSAMEAVLEGPGTLSFEWWVSSEEGGDVLSLALDGCTVASVSGCGRGWWPVTVGVEGEGTHVVRWTYRKDAVRSAGEDAGRVRNLDWGFSHGAFLSPAEAAKRLADPATDTPPDGSAATYIGYLCDAKGAVVGTVTVKTAHLGRDGRMRTTVKVANLKSKSFQGYYDPAFHERQAISTKPDAPEILLGRDSLSGVYDGCFMVGVRQGAYSGPVGVFPVAWPETPSCGSDGDGGWNAVSLSLDKRGKVRFTGTLFDGVRVSASSQLLAGATNSCAVLVTARTALTIWFDNAEAMPDARGYPGVVADVLGSLDGSYLFSVDSDAGITDVPIVADGRRWKVLGENPARLKLTYNDRTGLFSGSYRTGAKVNGAVVGGKGYGSSVVRKSGTAAVKIVNHFLSGE